MADFSILPVGQTTSLLGNAISGAELEHSQLANNIANAETPNYRASNVDFKSALQQSLGATTDPDVLAMQTDSGRDFSIGGAVPAQPFDPKPIVDDTTQMRTDGSNVDIDQEMAQLSQNTGYQETVSQLLGQQYKYLRESITEQF